jgi:hypothetical protein
MCFLFSFIPATFWCVVGYFILYSTTKTEGHIQKFGKILAVWTFIIAVLIVICGAYMTLAGICPLNKFFE